MDRNEPTGPADDELKDAITGGAICSVCGGLHVPNIDTAITVLAAEGDGAEVPCCDCDCAVCAPFAERVARIEMEQEDGRSQSRGSPEDS